MRCLRSRCTLGGSWVVILAGVGGWSRHALQSFPLRSREGVTPHAQLQRLTRQKSGDLFCATPLQGLPECFHDSPRQVLRPTVRLPGTLARSLCQCPPGCQFPALCGLGQPQARGPQSVHPLLLGLPSAASAIEFPGCWEQQIVIISCSWRQRRVHGMVWPVGYTSSTTEGSTSCTWVAPVSPNLQLTSRTPLTLSGIWIQRNHCQRSCKACNAAAVSLRSRRCLPQSCDHSPLPSFWSHHHGRSSTARRDAI